MKKIIYISLSLLLFGLSLLAQPPQSFKYQAVARDNSGNVVANQNATFMVSITQGVDITSPVVYSETHSATTNQFGMVNLEIGNGTVVSGVFSEIHWGSGEYYFKVEMTIGTSGYVLGISRLLSVPYSLNASSLTLTDEWGNSYDVIVAPSGGLTVMPTGWTCGGYLTDERDGKMYATVQIGTQCWMAQNLNVGVMITSSNNQTNNGMIEKYCYNNDCSVYGGLYQWNEMMQYVAVSGTRGICPDGWHIPAVSEWNDLATYVGGAGVAGGKMKESGTAHWNFPNLLATNASGFTAFAAGHFSSAAFNNAGNETYFWSSTQYDGTSAKSERLHYMAGDLYEYFYDKNEGQSVRCIKGAVTTNQPPSAPSNPSPSDGAQSLSQNTILSWTCSDPENDPTPYDVYFGTSNPPPKVSSIQAVSTFNPGILPVATTYFWKIVAHDAYNSTSGPIWSFTTLVPIAGCGNPLADPRDGKSYNTVQIGSQCWMAQNINIGTQIAGSTNQTNNGVIEKYCYDNSVSNCDVYGGLYNWNEMMQYTTQQGTQGICMPGWHLPSYSEWNLVINYLGGSTVAGGKMKETGITHWYGQNYGATNESGFTGLPGGYCLNDYYTELHWRACMWSSTENEGTQGYYMNLLSDAMNIYLNGNWPKTLGLNVRCVKN